MSLQGRIRDVPWAAIDLETTGLQAAKGDRVIEVAVVRGGYGQEAEIWSSLVNPDRLVTNSDLHGITNEMLVGQPSFEDLLPEVEAKLEGAILIAHHARMDLGFLFKEFRKAGRNLPEWQVLDTLGLSRGLAGDGSRSLAALCASYQVPVLPNHRATADAHATYHLCARLLDRLDPEGLFTIEQALQAGARTRAIERHHLLARLQTAIGGPPIWVAYQGAEGTTHRLISVKRISGRKVEAYCQLRDAERRFRLDRLRLLAEDEL